MNGCHNCEHGEIYFDQAHFICDLDFSLHCEDFICENYNRRQE